MATSSPRARKRPGGGGPRIDWGAAEAFYFSDPLATFGDVARSFGVSDTAVRNHAKPGRWAERRDEQGAAIMRRLLTRAVRTREERAEHVLRIHDEVADQLQEQLLEKALDIKLSDFPAIAKVAALYAGDPTDRVSFDEMQMGFRTLMDVAARYVPKPKRAEFLAEVNEALGASE